MFGKILTQNGYNSSGNQLLYNGMTGEQLQANIEVEFKGSYTETTRRCALNMLKVIGRVPHEEQLEQLGKAHIISRSKSK